MKAPESTRSTQSENPDASSTTTCLFCLEENGPQSSSSSSSSSDAQPPTDHAFLFPCACRVMAHGACLNEWLNGELECPICREAVQWEWDGDLENPLNEVRRVVYEQAQSSGSSSSSSSPRSPRSPRSPPRPPPHRHIFSPRFHRSRQAPLLEHRFAQDLAQDLAQPPTQDTLSPPSSPSSPTSSAFRWCRCSCRCEGCRSERRVLPNDCCLQGVVCIVCLSVIALVAVAMILLGVFLFGKSPPHRL